MLCTRMSLSANNETNVLHEVDCMHVKVIHMGIDLMNFLISVFAEVYN